MDIGDKDKFELEKRTEDALNYLPPNPSSDWQFGGANFMNSSMGSVPIGNPNGSSSCSSAPMVDSFCPTPWDHPINLQNLGFCDINVRNNTRTSNTMGIGKVGAGALRTGIDRSRTLDIGWNPPSSMLNGGFILPNSPGLLPQSLSQFPTDSGFIERAARFSCFSSGNFSDMVNPFSIAESMSPHLRVGAAMQRPQEALMGIGMKAIPGGHSQMNELNMVEASKDAALPVERRATEGSPLENENLVRSHYEAKQGVAVSGNESDEAEFSGGCQEEPCMIEGTGGEPSAKGLGSKKRKRSGQDTEPDQVKGAPQHSGEATKDNTEIQQKGDQNLSTTTNKNTGKNGKQGSQASDPAKDEYIHVRARRGQATNSHSLAERVRREKISERMKFLQDLVPGCSKVTGKAVMLDEIISYVQSLQREVEFLSMKLATVNPRLDFNIEGLLTKDILQSHAGPSSTLGFSPDLRMTYPQLHPSQPGLIQVGLPGLGNSADTFRRTMNTQLVAMSGEFKESTPQLPNAWEDELHNVVQMGCGPSTPADSQDLNGSSPPDHMKVGL